MSRLSKIILIVFASLVVLIVAALAGALFYVESASGRAQVEEAVGDALGLPVKIGKLTVKLPATVLVETVTTVEDPTRSRPRIAANSLLGTLALRPLLAGDVEITSAVLEAPIFEWPQNAEGRWAWPEEEEKPREPDAPGPEKKKDAPGRKSSVLARGIKIERGTVVMRNAKGQPVIQAEGVTMELTEASETQLLGVVSAARFVWGERYALENFRTNLRYTNSVLELDSIDAGLFGGSLRGGYEMDTKGEGQPFKARLELRAVDLNAFAKTSGWEDGEIAGRLSADAEVSGRTDRIARLEGPGRLSIDGGRFTKLGVFGTIAEVIGITELANLRTRTATAQFNLRDEKTFIDTLVLATENIEVSAKGVARFDGKLTLDAQLSVPDGFVKTLPEIARGSFTKREDGRQALDFKITGKTNKPKTDLAERLIGGKVQDKIGDLLGSLFGSKPEKKDEKKDEKKKDDERESKPDPKKE